MNSTYIFAMILYSGKIEWVVCTHQTGTHDWKYGFAVGLRGLAAPWWTRTAYSCSAQDLTTAKWHRHPLCQTLGGHDLMDVRRYGWRTRESNKKETRLPACSCLRPRICCMIGYCLHIDRSIPFIEHLINCKPSNVSCVILFAHW